MKFWNKLASSTNQSTYAWYFIIRQLNFLCLCLDSPSLLVQIWSDWPPHRRRQVPPRDSRRRCRQGRVQPRWTWRHHPNCQVHRRQAQRFQRCRWKVSLKVTPNTKHPSKRSENSEAHWVDPLCWKHRVRLQCLLQQSRISSTRPAG